MVTDEMVEKASLAYYYGSSLPADPRFIRAALEAVAPALIAQGMREAHRIIADTPMWDKYNDDGSMSPDWENYMGKVQIAILDRAQELDPK